VIVLFGASCFFLMKAVEQDGDMALVPPQLWDIANDNRAWEFRHPMERHPITCLDADRSHGLLAGGSMYGMLQACAHAADDISAQLWQSTAFKKAAANLSIVPSVKAHAQCAGHNETLALRLPRYGTLWTRRWRGRLPLETPSHPSTLDRTARCSRHPDDVCSCTRAMKAVCTHVHRPPLVGFLSD
jgi:hypothetical protein